MCNLHSYSFGQYFFNDSANIYFLKLIENQNSSEKNIAFISHFVGTYAQGVNPIINSGSTNYLSDKEDSLTILKYLHDHDSLFNMNTLIRMVKNDQAVFYAYYDTAKKYDKTKSDSIYYYPVNFLREYSDSDFQEYLKRGESLMRVDFKNEYFKVVLALDKQDNKVTGVKPLGIISYGKQYYSFGELYGYLGYGCFVFK